MKKTARAGFASDTVASLSSELICSTILQEIKLIEEVGMPREEIDCIKRRAIKQVKNYCKPTKRSLDIRDLVDDEVNADKSV